MLRNILSGKTCAECRKCCVFDRYDIWEAPVFSAENLAVMRENGCDADFVSVSGGFMFKAESFGAAQEFACPALGENGCILGNEKPPECRIFPLRVMDKDGVRVIAADTVCTVFAAEHLSELVRFVRSDGFADRLFACADENPHIVRPYLCGLPIAAYESPERQ